MNQEITLQMKSVIDFIRENGGSVSPDGGGFWRTTNERRLTCANTTQTIYALAKRGLLRRANYHRMVWRDTYFVVEDAQ
jgi:hypothetical protein